MSNDTITSFIPRDVCGLAGCGVDGLAHSSLASSYACSARSYVLRDKNIIAFGHYLSRERVPVHIYKYLNHALATIAVDEVKPFHPLCLSSGSNRTITF